MGVSGSSPGRAKEARGRCLQWLQSTHAARFNGVEPKLDIPPESLEKLREVFDEYARENRGGLQLEDLWKLLGERDASHAVTKEEAAGALALADLSKDGVVSFTELTDVIRSLREARVAFNQLDVNGDGELSRWEARALLVGALGFDATHADEAFAAAVAAGDAAVMREGRAPKPNHKDRGLTRDEFSALWWLVSTGQLQADARRRPDETAAALHSRHRATLDVLVHLMYDWRALAEQLGVLEPESVVVPPHGTSSDVSRSMPFRLLLAGTSSSVATLSTNPIDVVKVALQLRSYGQGVGIGTIVRRMVADRGVLNLWSGIGPAIARDYTYTAMRLGFYEPAKTLVGADEHPTLARKIFAGVLSGGTAAALANPVEVVKIRAQASAGREGARESVMQLIRGMGFGGALTGVQANVARGMAITSSQMATYDSVKHGLIDAGVPEGFPLQLGCSLLAGLVTTTASSPFDVIKTVTMASSEKMSIPAAVRHVATTDGLRGFFRGWSMNYTRIGPHTMILLMTYEALRKAVGMGSV